MILPATILVDASVLIDFLRTKEPKLDGLYRSLPVAVCGVTRAEILAGARGAKDRQRLLLFLNQFQQVPTPDSCWDLVGDNLAALYAGRGHGSLSRCRGRHPRHRE